MKDKIPISEEFYSLSGEGPNIGTPTVFVRTFGCNMKPVCSWCDSMYAVKKVDDTVKQLSLQDIAKQIHKFNCADITFTGGEPLLYEEELCEISRILQTLDPRCYYFHFETNGLLLPKHSQCFDNVSYIVSPKLHALNKKYLETLQEWFANTSKLRFVSSLKFVYENKESIVRIRMILSRLPLLHNPIYIMPEGNNLCVEKYKECAEVCLEYGWNMSARLQNIIWGPKRGV